MDRKMAWEEIAIGFNLAGFMAVFVPPRLWAGIFLADVPGLSAWVRVLENAVFAPFVAALTCVGSMGNIPLATVLDLNSVLFAGIMGFIYSDLMVPPSVRINACCYGWRLALHLARIMYASIVVTALLLHGAFPWLGWIPETGRVVSEATQFALGYTLSLNLAFAGASVWLTRPHRRYLRLHGMAKGGHDGDGPGVKRLVVYVSSRADSWFGWAWGRRRQPSREEAACRARQYPRVRGHGRRA
jgi:hypothetical protein